MPILSDCHLHTNHSGDSDAPMEEMILRGIQKGLHTMCFTEHMDFDFPDSEEGPGTVFLVDTDSYLKEFTRMKEKYSDQIRLLFGVELGLQPHLCTELAAYTASYDFDFIIGSSHICHKKDPYYPPFYEGRTKKEAYTEYFESILENLNIFPDFDSYGHLDYVVRYGPDKDLDYDYESYKDVLDPILRALIEKGKGLEINTGGLKSGLKDLHPCMGILRRYKELGGEIITVGSDAHSPQNIATHFDRAAHVLESCGFQYYTIFENRKPVFMKL